MGLVRYRCPKTGDQVESAIEASKDVLVRMGESNLTLWLWCPNCMVGHQVHPSDATSADEIKPVRSPSVAAR
jgi:hypothetical protein